ncbi:MAG: UDP-N-acetylgalactosamine-undecaprenyl-phosphate N-acetylgalactosaminephosphotransferase [Parcubacteria group bacterium ADurb.Bin247]|nr:MAG: UDP-N-acetylgalactosamine-undecaprenyl-phosphate N-acetylgalactosaminephosphotransferase [Parcubacteria group bacterium ADurb.Bin247]
MLNKKQKLIYFIGDLCLFVIALWITLFLRHFAIPSFDLFYSHIVPFSILFIAWFFVFYIFGLYDKPKVLIEEKVLSRVLVVSAIIGIVFFYLIPIFSITPKTNLLIYLIVLFSLIFLWRSIIDYFFEQNKNAVLLIGSSQESEELLLELDKNCSFKIDRYSSDSSLSDYSIIIVDLEDEKVKPIVSRLYNLIFSGVLIIDISKLYEDVFKRVSLSYLDHRWFLKNISSYSRVVYDPLKRIIDISISLVLGVISLPLYPFICLAIKLNDGGSCFIVQKRIGQKGKIINVIKFRTMKVNDSGVWVKENDDRITSVGKFLRKSRLDELPQLLNILKGDMSLVGPRPDIYGLLSKLEEEIPYYNIRTAIRPGLSGWAQVNQEKPPQSVEETKTRLMYDLYYIKNRSLWLDLKIILKTIVIIASRNGV